MKLLIIISAAIGLGASIANAQRIPVNEPNPKSSSVLGQLTEGKRPDSKGTRQVMQDFARCLARRNASGIDQFLSVKGRGLPASLAGQAPDCLGNSAGDESVLSGQADAYRYALAEAFVVRKYRDKGIGDVHAIATLDHADEAGPHQESGLGTLSECIIRGAPGESWALLRTDAASVEEKAAFSMIGPAMQSCVRQGTMMKMPAFFVRGAIAETYYLLSKAPRMATGAAK